MKYEILLNQLRDPIRLSFCTESDAVLIKEAADAIEELSMKLHGDEAAIAGMKREIERMVVAGTPKWIPVTERLPEVGKSVLVISYGRVCFAKLLLTKNNGGFPTFVLQDGLNNPPILETTAHNEFTKNRITHWMPLPSTEGINDTN